MKIQISKKDFFSTARTFGHWHNIDLVDQAIAENLISKDDKEILIKFASNIFGGFRCSESLIQKASKLEDILNERFFVKIECEEKLRNEISKILGLKSSFYLGIANLDFDAKTFQFIKDDSDPKVWSDATFEFKKEE